MRTRTPLTGVARKLRSTLTEQERLLWYRLRDRRFARHKFRRQFVVGAYVVDFVCLRQKLIVEIDGGQHTEQVEYDEQRTRFLVAAGFRVVRFWNDEVMTKLEDVLGVIHAQLEKNGPSP
jgi:very-short-patch-repair endonuclease